MMCDARLWRDQIDALCSRRPVVCADFGDAGSVRAMAGIARGEIERLAPDGGAVAVAGLSMGGIVAFELWRRAPERIAGLALLNTNHQADAPDRRRVRERQIAAARAGRLYWLLRDELKPAYPGASALAPEVMDAVMAMGLRLGPDIFVAQSLALLDRPDSTATLPTIRCPVLVLCGAEDGLCPVSRHREMADALPDADLVVLDHCGHLSTLEQPAAVNQALEAWLERIDSLQATRARTATRAFP
jgi:pimeloyl-ACP methyl ester carboxylesterase